MYRKNTQKILPLSLINTANTKNITPISYQHCKYKYYYPYLLSTLQIQKILPLSLINTANSKIITPISYQHCKYKNITPISYQHCKYKKYYPYLLSTLQIQKILPLSLINTANTKLYIIFVTLKM